MATETQKNFRRQMKELAEEYKYTISPPVYSYINKDFITNKITFTSRNVISISGIITIVFLAIYILNGISGSTNFISAYSQQPVVSYMQQQNAYEYQRKMVNQSLSENFKNLNLQSVESRNQFILSMNTLLTNIQELQVKTSQIKVPKGMEEYNNLLRISYQNLYDCINNYIRGVSGNNQEYLNSGKISLDNYNALNNKINIALMTAFDKYKIKYEIQGDGSIRYWYKSTSGVY